MQKDIELYIGSQKVEFAYPPSLLYSYTLTDLTNPTAVKNSFSKTITIEGTPNNNNLFGQYWNVERITVSNGSDTGALFNASKKVGFWLYVDSELYETGYVKLDAVHTEGGKIEYDITLYGGLGEFFYLLSYNADGEKLNLADLKYTDETRMKMWTIGNSDEGVTTIDSTKENEFDFRVSKEMLYEAWLNCGPWASDTYLWHFINFAPAYNGVPDNDFDPSRVLLNLQGSNLKGTASDGGVTYQGRGGYSMGTLTTEMTEHEIRDYRSYLQRPVIRVMEIVQAIKRYAEAAGWTLELDPDFFQYDNAYYVDSWMTLPMLCDLEYENTEEVLTGQTLQAMSLVGTPGDGNISLMFNQGTFGTASLKDLSVTFRLNAEFESGAQTYIYPSYCCWGPGGKDMKIEGYSSVFIQLVAYNGDTLVGYSDVKNLTNRIYNDKQKAWFSGGNEHYDSSGRYWYGEGYGQFTQKHTMVDGYFFRTNAQQRLYKWVNKDGSDQITINITNCTSPVTELKLRVFWGCTSEVKKNYGDYWYGGFSMDANYKWSKTWSTHYTCQNLMPEIISNNVNAIVTNAGKTGTKIGKKLLLSTDYSPCEWFLSYCKQFGLYFLKDATENKVSVLTRKSFYDRTEPIDLSNYIDRSKEIHMTPLTFSSKWYEFNLEQDETQYHDNYYATYGKEFGSQIVNTGYDFDAEKKPLLENSILKSGVEGLEKSKYFSSLSNDNGLKPWMLDNFSYTLYNGENSFDVSVTTRVTPDYIYGINNDPDLKYYDVTPKVQFHDADNGRTDGDNVLLFFNGFKPLSYGKSIPLKYWLTDDNAFMMNLNDSESCWLYTEDEYDQNGNRIAIRLTDMPVFERYVTDNDSGYILKSWDFGHSREVYVPYYVDRDNTTIYENFWKSYIEDMFDVDNRVLTCWVHLTEKPNPLWLQKFFWFDNAIWRLNSIKDWEIVSDNTTQMEFLKVLDMSDYTSETQSSQAKLTFELSQYTIGAEGGTITGYITISDGGNWYIDDDGRLDISARQGAGDGVITITVPSNSEDYEQVFRISVVADNRVTATIRQFYAGQVRFHMEPEDLIIPASGGTYTVDVVWDYQGTDYLLNGADRNEAEEYLEFTADTQTLRAQNKAILRFGENNTQGVLTNYATFETAQDGAHFTMGLAQLPYEAGFAPSGQSQTYTINYVSGAEFTNLPYWISVTDNGDNTYTFTSLPNDYDTERSGNVVLTKAGSSASFEVNQGAGGGVIVKKVSPDHLEFVQSGGSQFVTVNISGNWKVIGKPDWITLSQTYGTSNSVVGVTASANDGDNSRNRTITVLDVDNNIQYEVSVYQAGTQTARSITASPNPLVFDKDGETKVATITYTNKGSDFIEIENNNSWLSYTLGPWTGDSRTISVTAQTNEGLNQRSGNIILHSNELSDYNIVCTQDGQRPSEYYVDFNPPTLTIPQNGGIEISRGTGNLPTYDSLIYDTDVEWLEASISGSTTGYCLVAAICREPNTGTSRTGTISIYYQNILVGEIHVVQEGVTKTLTISPSSISFDPEGGTATINITSNTDWVIE